MYVSYIDEIMESKEAWEDLCYAPSVANLSDTSETTLSIRELMSAIRGEKS